MASDVSPKEFRKVSRAGWYFCSLPEGGIAIVSDPVPKGFRVATVSEAEELLKVLRRDAAAAPATSNATTTSYQLVDRKKAANEVSKHVLSKFAATGYRKREFDIVEYLAEIIREVAADETTWLELLKLAVESDDDDDETSWLELARTLAIRAGDDHLSKMVAAINTVESDDDDGDHLRKRFAAFVEAVQAGQVAHAGASSTSEYMMKPDDDHGGELVPVGRDEAFRLKDGYLFDFGAVKSFYPDYRDKFFMTYKLMVSCSRPDASNASVVTSSDMADAASNASEVASSPQNPKSQTIGRNELVVDFPVLVANYNDGEVKAFQYLHPKAKGDRRQPRNWKRLLNYHRLVWNIISQSQLKDVQNLYGWQEQLVVWVFLCFNWKEQMDDIFENWEKLVPSFLERSSDQESYDRIEKDLSSTPTLSSIIQKRFSQLESEWKKQQSSDNIDDKQKQQWKKLQQTLNETYDVSMLGISIFQNFRVHCNAGYLQCMEQMTPSSSSF